MREYRYYVRVAAPSALVLLLAGCACPSPVTPPTPPSAQLTVSVKEIPTDRPPSQLNDLYIRIKAVPADRGANTVIDKKSSGKLLKEKLTKYLWDNQEALGVTLNGTIDGQSFGKRAVILADLKNKQQNTYGDDYLTPYFRASDSLVLQWDKSWTKSVDTNAITVAGEVLSVVSGLYAPNGIIFQTIKNVSGFDEKLAKADDGLGKVFSDGVTVVGQRKTIDLASIKGYEIRIDNDEPVIRVDFETRESVLSPNGTAALIPQRPVDIKGSRIAGGKLLQTLVQGDDGQSELIQMINRDTADGYAQFCERASVALSGKGYNYIDRAAILYAYLKESNWNNKQALRNASDSCYNLVSEGLTTIGNPKMQLASAQDLSAAALKDRDSVVATLNQKKNGFWDSLSSRLASPSDEYLDSVATQSVSLLSVKYDLQLTDAILLKAGIPRVFTQAELAPVLRDARLTYDKDKALKNGVIDKSCYSINNLPNSSFRAFCFYPQAGSRPITMEFNFDGDFASDKDGATPKLSMLKFFPVAPTAAPVAATDGNSDMASR